MGTKRPFEIIDCDGHILEPLDLWDRYIDSSYRDRANEACSIINHDEGGATLRLNGDLFDQRRSFQSAGTFGIAHEDAAKRRWSPEEICRGGFDPGARVADQMDPGNIEAALLFGSQGNQLNGVKDAGVLAPMCRAYNTWLLDEYCGSYPERMFPIALLPWHDPDLSVQELKWAVQKGFKGIKAPAKRRFHKTFIYDEGFYPLWEVAQEAGVVLAIHPSSVDRLPDMSDVLTREEGSLNSNSAILSPLNGIVSLTQLIFGGVLDRFPRLKVCVVECNGGWMPLLLDRLDGRYNFQPWASPEVKSLPSESFRRQCWVAFMAEERTTLPLFAESFQDHIVWGTDYPHLDAETTDEIWETLERVPETVQRKILRENAIRLYNLPLAS